MQYNMYNTILIEYPLATIPALYQLSYKYISVFEHKLQSMTFFEKISAAEKPKL